MIGAELTGFTPAWAPVAIRADMSKRRSSTGDGPIKHEAPTATVCLSSGWQIKSPRTDNRRSRLHSLRLAANPRYRPVESPVASQFNNLNHCTGPKSLQNEANWDIWHFKTLQISKSVSGQRLILPMELHSTYDYHTAVIPAVITGNTTSTYYGSHGWDINGWILRSYSLITNVPHQ